ncbi:MAG: ChbG/HpnK family deacetylase [Desulfobacteraceae bacterium]|nr:MAG: ChbG/HpnK family deacetylase [Desulfobacteraceae bacterium]
MSIIGHIKKKFSPSLVAQLGYSDKDILVIVNIDDVGLHKDETEASFRALNFGMVKSGSIMAPCPNFDHVMKLWKENPDTDLGVHLTLTCEWGGKYPWAPVFPKTDVPSLYNPEGIMWPTTEALLLHSKRKDIVRELEAQINKVLDTGLKPSHIDYHMNFGFHTDLFPIIIELSHKFNLPLRVPKRKIFKLPFVKNNVWSLRRKGYIFPDTRKGIYMMGGDDQSLEFRKMKYHDHLRSLKPGVHNINVHIAFQTKELQYLMGWHDSSIRQIDYDVWTSDDIKKLAEELGITFIGYRPLQKLQERLLNRM